ncbi:hypothetical protein POJ06DRAFT_193854 [Lipomyces tetrasporus]|uniref:JmjC domain-containing protein n=1 Tax=Lipomyces tetrasporus TaxID=54092 RepID=A0AAD7QVD3_9ASCO|nr:uncharacterized protein POJ06DRAFT_193854 [Lipomyces tetrasporus]KAJ8102162.1 hypothetical protein POJ06DRAFT_193854 [Lipomyces tetrasporus]
MADPYNIAPPPSTIQVRVPSANGLPGRTASDEYFSAAMPAPSPARGPITYTSPYDSQDSIPLVPSQNLYPGNGAMSYGDVSAPPPGAYDPAALCIDPIFTDPSLMSAASAVPMNQAGSSYYATTNLFEAAAYGGRADIYLPPPGGDLPVPDYQSQSTPIAIMGSPADPALKRPYNEFSPTDQDVGDESESDETGWGSHKRKVSKKKKSKDPSKKIKAAQVRPPFANDKPIIVNPDKSMFWFVQAKNCQSMNVGIRRCRACTRRKSGVGACRFIGVRVFQEDVSGPYYDGEDPDYAFSDQLNLGHGNDSYGHNMPSEGDVYTGRIWKADFVAKVHFAVPPRSAGDINYVLDSIAPAFSNMLDQELQLEKQETLLRIVPKEGEGYRSLCDICGTSLFSGRYMCYYCGLEMCLDCYDDWNNLGDDNNGKLVRNTLRFVFEFCAYGNRHQQNCLIPVTRMMPGDIQEIYSSVYSRVPQMPSFSSSMNPGDLELQSSSASWAVKKEGGLEIAGFSSLTSSDPSDNAFISNTKPIEYQDGELSVDEFRAKWSEGTPLVIHGAGKRLKLDWSDSGFIQRYGRDRCALLDDNGQVFEETIRDFFEGFASGVYNGRKMNLKLKDWPTNGDLKDVCPELFEDFENALPFPIYTRRDGFLNLASMFPKEFNPPDLGPKLYNAYASSHGPNGRGSTTLHLDVTDAVNIMAFAYPNGSLEEMKNIPGVESSHAPQPIGAVWDIFKAEDSGKVRQFILEREQEDPIAYNNPFLTAKREKAKGSKVVPRFSTDDPIHRQVFYLPDGELILLRKRFGVVPFRIWQKPGDAVFIPAGCAHQVCNISSCVKAAIDFVSPENIPRCVNLLQETRNLARVKKKEDVLQLKQILYFAWIKATDMLLSQQWA